MNMPDATPAQIANRTTLFGQFEFHMKAATALYEHRASGRAWTVSDDNKLRKVRRVLDNTFGVYA